jgi:hypothetical protein
MHVAVISKYTKTNTLVGLQRVCEQTLLCGFKKPQIKRFQNIRSSSGGGSGSSGGGSGTSSLECFQGCMQSVERWPIVGFLIPTLLHQVVHIVGAARRLLQSGRAHFVHSLPGRRVSWIVWNRFGVQLPQQHCEHPNVGLLCVSSVF